MWSTENLSVTLSSRNVFSRPLPGGHFYYPRARRGVFRGMVLPGRVSGPGQGLFSISPILPGRVSGPGQGLFSISPIYDSHFRLLLKMTVLLAAAVS